MLKTIKQIFDVVFPKWHYLNERLPEPGFYWIDFVDGRLSYQIVIQYPEQIDMLGSPLATRWLGPISPPKTPREQVSHEIKDGEHIINFHNTRSR
jgi:hypothetical protein